MPQSSVYKANMFLLPKFSGTLAALAMLLLVAFASTAAFAHGGHKHSAAIETKADASERAGERVAQELSSTDIVTPHVQHDDTCGDRGCCGNGHCAGCVTALAPAGLAEFSPLAASLRRSFDAVLPPGLGTSGPPRPPKSFV
ncbi:MAG: hypothetical protein ABW198_06135 [Pseudorhodoplanes sp.]